MFQNYLWWLLLIWMRKVLLWTYVIASFISLAGRFVSDFINKIVIIFFNLEHRGSTEISSVFNRCLDETKCCVSGDEQILWSSQKTCSNSLHRCIGLLLVTFSDGSDRYEAPDDFLAALSLRPSSGAASFERTLRLTELGTNFLGSRKTRPSQTERATPSEGCNPRTGT